MILVELYLPSCFKNYNYSRFLLSLIFELIYIESNLEKNSQLTNSKHQKIIPNTCEVLADYHYAWRDADIESYKFSNKS